MKRLEQLNNQIGELETELARTIKDADKYYKACMALIKLNYKEAIDLELLELLEKREREVELKQIRIQKEKQKLVKEFRELEAQLKK